MNQVAEILPKQARAPIFIADPEGIFCFAFAEAISSDFLPIILTKKQQPSRSSDFVTISYRKIIPKLPDNAFEALYIFEGAESVSGDLLHALIKASEEKKVPLYLLTSIERMNEKRLQTIHQKNKCTLFFYGDVIDVPSLGGRSSEILEEAKATGKVKLPQQGLTPIYPITSKFVLESLIRHTLLQTPSRSHVFLLPHGELYELTFYRIMQKCEPSLRLDFSKKGKVVRKKTIGPKSEESFFEARESLENAVLFLFRKPVVTSPARNRHHEGRRFPRIIVSVSLSIFILLLVFMSLVFGTAYFGKRFLLQSLRETSTLSFKNAEASAKESAAAFSLSASMGQFIKPAITRSSLEERLDTFLEQVATGEEVAVSVKELLAHLRVYKDAIDQKKVVRPEEFRSLTQSIKSSLLLLSQLEGEDVLPDTYSKKLRQYKTLSDVFLSSEEVLPQLAGYSGERNYLLLFQNNNELRPTGGFIGSYAVVRVKDGMIGDISVEDVYDADGQLRGHVEPPSALKKYLGVAHWYLRDSNFSPDFPTSAGNAAYFLNLETGKHVDGVVAVDTAVLKSLVHSVGPIDVPGLPGRVTEDNVVQLVQKSNEDTFFPGSTQKKDTLSLLFAAIMQRLEQGVTHGKSSLLDVIESGLEQKHILVALGDQSLEKPFLLQGVSSSLETPVKEEDFVGVNEANIGVNKVNAFIARSFMYHFMIAADGSVRVGVTETLENESSRADEQAGDYKAFVRLLLPQDVSPDALAIDGVEQVVLAPLQNVAAYQKRGEVAANTIEVERVDEKGKSTYGFLVTVPQGEKKTISFTYTPKIQQFKANTGTYSLMLFKQPGTGPDPYRLVLTMPKDFDLFSSTIPFDQEGETYSRLSLLTSDQRIGITYGKK